MEAYSSLSSLFEQEETEDFSLTAFTPSKFQITKGNFKPSYYYEKRDNTFVGLLNQ